MITLGNHTWNRLQIADFLDSDGHILRPANYAGRVPGPGLRCIPGPAGVRIGLLNLMGRLELNSNLDSPFQAADPAAPRRPLRRGAGGLPRGGHQ